ncbi:MAG TPA: hypothetical protein VFW07_14350 [Parafilimonas sp.]|nr:hypothetical protein [Parafilimonas sp.]
MIELVIDTNIFIHAENENYEYQDDCILLLNTIIESDDIFVCIDENGKIWNEYSLHIKPGMLANAMFLKLGTERLKLLPRNIHAHINKKINQTGIKEADRIFVRIAYKTQDKILVSDEHEDFVNKIREIIKKEIGVDVIMANECAAFGIL